MVNDDDAFDTPEILADDADPEGEDVLRAPLAGLHEAAEAGLDHAAGCDGIARERDTRSARQEGVEVIDVALVILDYAFGKGVGGLEQARIFLAAKAQVTRKEAESV